MKRGMLVAMAMALSACGAKQTLEPEAGQPLPVAPYAAAEQPTGDKLLIPPPQTRPARSDDLIESSNERRSDEFDLPPN